VTNDHEALVARAVNGDADALAALVRELQGFVYNLSMRMLWHPQDAEDAAQEILLRIITRLDRYRGESAFTTWAYRIAVNYLLTTRKRRAEQQAMTAAEFAEDLAAGMVDPPPGLDSELLAEEVKIGCTHAMLMMLDRPHRVAFILGDVFGLNSETAAALTSVTAVAHRQRLARSRRCIRDFMSTNCGLVNPAASCRCARRIAPAIAACRVDPDRPLFAGHPRRTDVQVAAREMESLHSAAAVYRAEPDWLAPATVTSFLDKIFREGRLRILAD